MASSPSHPPFTLPCLPCMLPPYSQVVTFIPCIPPTSQPGCCLSMKWSFRHPPAPAVSIHPWDPSLGITSSRTPPGSLIPGLVAPQSPHPVPHYAAASTARHQNVLFICLSLPVDSKLHERRAESDSRLHPNALYTISNAVSTQIFVQWTNECTRRTVSVI